MTTKYKAYFWAFIIFAMAVIGGVLSAPPAHAAEKTHIVRCAARVVKVINSGNDYFYAIVAFEKGSFREVPTNDEHSASFFNLDTQKILIIGDRAAGGLFMSVYRNADQLKAGKPEYQDNCYISKE